MCLERTREPIILIWMSHRRWERCPHRAAASGIEGGPNNPRGAPRFSWSAELIPLQRLLVPRRQSKGLCKNKIRLSAGILAPGHPPFEARQIRSPKSEIRNKFKIRKLQGSKRREAAWFCDSVFGPSGLFRISSFGFRILGKVTIPPRNDSESPEVIFARALMAKFLLRLPSPQ